MDAAAPEIGQVAEVRARRERADRRPSLSAMYCCHDEAGVGVSASIGCGRCPPRRTTPRAGRPP
jgi:hypothetical protein